MATASQFRFGRIAAHPPFSMRARAFPGISPNRERKLERPSRRRYFRSTMTAQDDDRVTQLLHRWREGDAGALDRLLPQVYADLRRLAASLLRTHPGHGTLQTTALVNDVLLHLLGKPPSAFNDTAHLLNAAARMMRQALVDRARRAATDKHGGGWSRADFEAALEVPVADGADVQSLDRALDELAEVDERMAKGVELRWFVGLEVAEIAAVLGITERTAYRDWCTAREWLRTRLDAIA